MVNKRVSMEDLVSVQVYLTPTQKEYLKSLKPSYSKSIRDMIDGHKSRPNQSLEHDYEELRINEVDHAILLNKIKNREEQNRQDTVRRNERENIEKRGVEILVRLYKEHRGDFGKFPSPLQTWAEALQISQSDLEGVILDAVNLGVE